MDTTPGGRTRMMIATMIMNLTLMSDVNRNRKSVIATPGDF